MSRIRRIVVLIACCTAVAFAQNGAAASSEVPPNQAQPARPQLMRVGGEVMQGLVEHRALPRYPDEAMTKGIQGDVIFKIDVDETGKIVLSVPVEGDPLLVAASMDALRDFRFRPYLLSGTPIRVESQLGFHFSVEKNTGGINGHVECITSIPNRPEFRTGVVNDKGVLVLDPRKVSGVEPQLPPELAGKSGSVYLTITIGVDGKVQDVKVVGGDEAFIGPVVAAVRQDVYEPQLVDGKPSVATTEASYHFGPRH
jgi:outer membrane biosynthesis protein TonB